MFRFPFFISTDWINSKERNKNIYSFVYINLTLTATVIFNLNDNALQSVIVEIVRFLTWGAVFQISMLRRGLDLYEFKSVTIYKRYETAVAYSSNQ